MQEKIAIDLEGVPKTLLLPLLGRAQLSQKSYSPIRDPRAVELVEALDFDFDELLVQVGESSPLWWVARAYHFDHAIKDFLRYYPKATIVNLGAGLDTMFYRVDNGKLTWVDLDLPEVMALRTTLLPPPPRVHYLATSALDTSWFAEVKRWGNPVFFVAGGLIFYFTEDQAKQLLLQLAENFPRAELIFDTSSKKGMSYANNMLENANMAEARLQWGMDDPKILTTWSEKIQLLSSIPWFKRIKVKYRFPVLQRFKMFMCDFSYKHAIVHIRFARNLE